eukprot:11163873-Lingulodinium_polyedra.AAC.1
MSNRVSAARATRPSRREASGHAAFLAAFAATLLQTSSCSRGEEILSESVALSSEPLSLQRFLG